METINSEIMNTKLPEIIPGVIRTFTGVELNILKPDPAMICIEDIAHALSNQCRFTGHTAPFYSVAEHSIHVALGVEENQALAALLHDASEAYLTDIPSPLKMLPAFDEYRRIEANLMKVIAGKYGFEYPLHASVEREDKFLLQHEWDKLMIGNQHKTMLPAVAKYTFLQAFDKITSIES